MTRSFHQFKVLRKIMHQWFQMDVILLISLSCFLSVIFFSELTFIINCSYDIWNIISGIILIKQLTHPLGRKYTMLLYIEHLLPRKWEVFINCLLLIGSQLLFWKDFHLHVWSNWLIFYIILRTPIWISLWHHHILIFLAPIRVFS